MHVTGEWSDMQMSQDAFLPKCHDIRSMCVCVCVCVHARAWWGLIARWGAVDAIR